MPFVVFSVINNLESVVTITPIGDAPTYVNGNLILEPTILHHVSIYRYFIENKCSSYA